MAETMSSSMTPETFQATISAEAETVSALRLSLGGVALKTAAEKKLVLDAAEELLEAATELLEAVEETSEDRVPFGGEDSYWTVYRFFTSEKNRFQLLTIEQVWKLLSKNYDMSLETPETVWNTLFEWAGDIEADAKTRLGISGSFEEFEGKLVFSELWSSTSNATVIQPKPTHGETKSLEIPVATEVEPSQVLADIKEILESFADNTAPQADVKRALVAKYDTISHERLQLIINELAAGGHIYKTRPGKVAHLSLLAPIKPSVAVNPAKPEKDVEEDRSFEVEIKVLTALTAPGVHFQQTRTPEELARVIFDISKSQKVPDEMTEAVRKACRQLQRINVLEGGRKKIGSSGVKTNSATSSKRRRTASNEVFKVGLVSQQVKTQIQLLIESGELEQHLSEQFTYVR